MECPKCGNPQMAKNGKTTALHQRYRCHYCGCSLTDSPNQHGGSRFLISGKRSKNKKWLDKTKPSV